MSKGPQPSGAISTSVSMLSTWSQPYMSIPFFEVEVFVAERHARFVEAVHLDAFVPELDRLGRRHRR